METIEMIVPPSLEITSQPPGAEFWYELQDGTRTPLYRRVQRNPLDSSVEVRTGNPERPLAHVDSGRAEGEFTLLVPSLPQARSVVLYEWSLPEDAVQRDLPPVPIRDRPIRRRPGHRQGGHRSRHDPAEDRLRCARRLRRCGGHPSPRERQHGPGCQHLLSPGRRRAAGGPDGDRRRARRPHAAVLVRGPRRKR